MMYPKPYSVYMRGPWFEEGTWEIIKFEFGEAVGLGSEVGSKIKPLSFTPMPATFPPHRRRRKTFRRPRSLPWSVCSREED